MTIQAVKTLFRVRAHFKFVDDRVLGVQMALRALATGAHKCWARLLDHHAGPPRIDQVGRENQGCRDGNRDENAAEVHPLTNWTLNGIASSHHLCERYPSSTKKYFDFLQPKETDYE